MTGRHRYKCLRCGREYPVHALRYQCDCNGGQNLEILDGVTRREAGQDPLRSRLHGLWRYAPLLAVEPLSSNLRVGGTPLIDCGIDEDVRLFVKDESRNPSGSLKDRASEVALAAARQFGYQRIVAASTGNAGASLACIAAAHGMAATVVVPAATPQAKLAQINAYGARVVRVDGDYDDAFDHAIAMSKNEGAFCRNTGYNPYTREGKKTCAFEIAEELDWVAPTWVVVPTGDGNILSGIAAGFRQLHRRGYTASVPRLIAAQAESSSSIVTDWAGIADTNRIPAAPTLATPATVADSVSVRYPRDHIGAITALAATRGIAVKIPEASIREASRRLARNYGLWFEPSSAIAYAAFRKCALEGIIAPHSTVVVIGTGSGLKDPDPWGDLDREVAPARSICPARPGQSATEPGGWVTT